MCVCPLCRAQFLECGKTLLAAVYGRVAAGCVGLGSASGVILVLIPCF